MVYEIPGTGRLDVRHLVLDYNGTIAEDGRLIPAARALMERLEGLFTLHVVTADTFGTVEKELEGLQVKTVVLKSGDHTREKADFVRTLGAERCAAVGNGNNDEAMLEAAALGVAVVGKEGCSVRALRAADILCRDASEALALFLHPKRLVATLRR